jgi:UDP-glucose 4-epimerase
MAEYLITGIAGFIGSSLARTLVARGERVRGVDNLSTGKLENIAAIREQIDFREADINDAQAMSDACRNVDFVLHQAAVASVPRSISDPAGTNLANVDGTLSVLLAAREAGVKRVVYASSSSLYGDAPGLPKHEDMVPSPISPYAVSKLAAEHYMTAFYRTYGLETVSLRYFNVFGPYQDPTSMYSGVLAIFINCMLRGEQPTILGDGEQSRDFTYIDNVVSANLLACNAPAEHVAGRAFNCATGEHVTLNHTYSLLQKFTGFNKPAAYGPQRIGDIKNSLADISLAKQWLGYHPSVNFEQGLGKTVAWYKEQSIAVAG